MKKKNNVSGLFRNFFLMFLIFQPFLDCYLLYSDEVINFFGFSPTTIIRLIIIGLYVLITYIKDNKTKKYITIYGIIVLIYIIIHHFVGISIDDSIIYKSFKYSITDEVFYFLRMLMPIGVIYVIYNLKYTKEEIKSIIKYSSLGIILIMIILNISGYALTSYSYNTKVILGNIFDWFGNNFSNYDLASKGWFNSANQISATIIILIIMMIYYSIIDSEKSDLVITILIIFSSMMLGTRTSTTIVIYLVIFMVFGYAILIFLQKKKNSLNKLQFTYSILIIVIAFIFYGIAPIGHCQSDSNYLCLFNIDMGLDSQDSIEVDQDLKYDNNTCEFLLKTPANEQYYKDIYPCEDNIEFWDNFSKNKIYEYANNRTMEVLIMNDVYSKIENPYLHLFGMSRSRLLSAEFYVEKDIYVHYYTIGILGIIVLLFIPYLLPCIILLLKIIKTKKIEFFELTMAFLICVIFFVAFLSGHILDELIVTLYLSFIVGILYQKLIDNYNKK